MALYHPLFEPRRNGTNMISLSSTRKISHSSQSYSSTLSLSSSTSPHSYTTSWSSNLLSRRPSKAMALRHYRMVKLWDSTAKRR